MSKSHTSPPPAQPQVRRAGRQSAYTGQARSYNRKTGAFRRYREAVVEALRSVAGR
jgi:hypothetical protein